MVSTEKGISQVDFAIAVSVLIVIFVFTVSHVSSYYSNAMQIIDTSKLRTAAFNLEKTAFEQKGVPPTWHWKGRTTRPSTGTTIYKMPVHLEEYNGTEDTWTVRIRNIDPGTSYGVSSAWNGSIKAYSEGEGVKVDVDTTEEGFLDQFDLLLKNIHMEPYEEKTVYIYYSQDNTTNSSYSDLTEDTDATVNITLLSERSLQGLTPYKLESLKGKYLQEIKEKYDVERNFNLTVYDSQGEILYTYGVTIPEGISVESYSNKLYYQNGTGHVKTVEAEATVWSA